LFSFDQDSADARRVIIVGAGLAGTAAAIVLGRRGLRVTLIDPRPNFPPVFKAEKIEAPQAAILRKLGLLDFLLPRAGHIREIRGYFKGRHFKTTRTEQYGLYYSDIVNTLRESLPETVEFLEGRVTEIANSPDLQRARLGDGRELTARLVVLACGLNPELLGGLGVKRTTIRMHHSAAVGFTLSRTDGSRFPFDAVTYYSLNPNPGLDYLTLFAFADSMRANLFAFPAEGDQWTRRFLQAPEKELDAAFPKLREAIGEYRIGAKVESSLIHLYRSQGEQPAGVVMIGDAAQNVCPSTGMGLTKVLTDVDVLCSECIPAWLASPGMGAEKLKKYSQDPRKLAIDAEALGAAEYRRKAVSGRSWRWRSHRARLRFEMQFGPRSVCVDEGLGSEQVARRTVMKENSSVTKMS
jgi:2-polyprenyl-6-methoxyphenol hydroxylase-like FAD-dependent oxidoreductase